MQSELAEAGLDADQLDAIRRIVKRERVTNPDAAQVLSRAVALTMSQFRAQIATRGYGMTNREIHDRLRVLWCLVEHPDPPVGQIRARLKELPEEVTLATGQLPSPGRSDEKPFGDLVHQVFGWLELPDATAALRRYWREWARTVECERPRADG